MYIFNDFRMLRTKISLERQFHAKKISSSELSLAMKKSENMPSFSANSSIPPTKVQNLTK